eukprot:2874062-Amphidinium_carterae.1
MHATRHQDSEHTPWGVGTSQSSVRTANDVHERRTMYTNGFKLRNQIFNLDAESTALNVIAAAV